MCDNCGCHNGHSHTPEHAPKHSHDGSGHGHRHIVDIQQSALVHNQRLADQNRGWFRAKRIMAYNLLSSPGSGKTAFLEACLRFLNHDCQPPHPAAAIVGDLQTENDAIRLRATGSEAIQITTGATCHLDAHMVAHALDELTTPNLEYVLIENVGNLVCPASYDLGEACRIVLLSVTEGEDKPLKYPVIFQKADIVLLTKMDLAHAVGFQRDAALAHISQVAPHAKCFEISVRQPDSLQPVLAELRDRRTGL